MYSKQRGSIIAFTLIVLSFILTSGLAVITVASLERKSGLVTQKSVTAFQAADGGAERILKRIYIDNSPSTMTIPKNGSMPDATLDDVAQNLTGVQAGATCNAATDAIVATSNSTPAYTFQATLLDGSDAVIDCADATWRDKVVRMKVDGFYRQAARVIEMGIKPRPKCDTTVDDTDGNTYDVIEIADMCWTKQNMQVGTRINTSTTPSNNGTIEYYCYSNNPSNCTADHPNYPDGGLYTWDEAMQYSTTEGAQGICPAGWHIPTYIEWYTLTKYIDSNTVDNDLVNGSSGCTPIAGTVGTQLKAGGSSGFEANYAGEISSGLSSGRQGGAPAPQDFLGFWTSKEYSSAPSSAWIYVSLGGGFENSVCRQALDKQLEGFSVRCVKDE